MTRALCFDQATATTGWAFGFYPSSDLYDFGSIKSPKREHFGERLAHIHASIVKLVEKYEPDLIGFEEPFFPVDRTAFSGPKAVPGRRSFLPPVEEPEGCAGWGEVQRRDRQAAADGQGRHHHHRRPVRHPLPGLDLIAMARVRPRLRSSQQGPGRRFQGPHEEASASPSAMTSAATMRRTP